MNEFFVGVPYVSTLHSAIHFESSASFSRSISAMHGNASQRPVF